MTKANTFSHFSLFLIVTFALFNTTGSLAITNDKSVPIEEKIGREFAAALSENDLESLNEFIDLKKVFTTAAEQVFDSRLSVRAFVSAAMKNNKDRQVFYSDVFRGYDLENSRIRYMRLIKTGNAMQPVIRIEFIGGGYDYLILHLRDSPKRKHVVIDFTSLSNGYPASTAFANTAALVTQPGKSLVSRWLGVKEHDEQLAEDLKTIFELHQKNENTKAYERLMELPENVRHSRTMIGLALKVSANVSEEEYNRQMGLLAKHHGDVASNQFMLLDYYFLREEWKKSIDAVDIIIDKIGADGALHDLKASISISASDLSSALAYSGLAIEAEPDFEAPYWTRSVVQASLKDFAGLVRTLSVLEIEFGHTLDAERLSKSEVYAGFTQSPEFAVWKKKGE